MSQASQLNSFERNLLSSGEQLVAAWLRESCLSRFRAVSRTQRLWQKDSLEQQSKGGKQRIHTHIQPHLHTSIADVHTFCGSPKDDCLQLIRIQLQHRFNTWKSRVTLKLLLSCQTEKDMELTCTAIPRANVKNTMYE